MTPADRQRAWRARQRAGAVVAPVPVPPAVVALLIDLGWLSEDVSEDRRAVADAIARVLSEAARDGKNTVTRLHKVRDGRATIPE